MLSIIVSWRDRNELQHALPKMLETVQRCGGEVVVVNYSGSSRALRNQIGTSDARIRTIEVPDQEYFNKSSAHNIGAARSHGDVLFFCDCDIVLNALTTCEIVAQITANPELFATLKSVRESEVNSRKAGHVVSFGYELRIRTADGRQLIIVDNEEDAETGLRQAPGLLFVRREHFLQVNGYNASLHGWGWEDQDMIGRLTLGLGLKRIATGEALHLSHDDTARLAHYPPVNSRWESRDRMFRRALANYDAGNFRGTYDVDNKTASSETN